MNEVITIGVDLAKNIFQVHGIDAEGTVIFRRQLRRSQVLPFFKKQPPCLVGMEACATAHFWARQLIDLGHEVKLIAPLDDLIRFGCCGIQGHNLAAIGGDINITTQRDRTSSLAWQFDL